MEKTWRWFGPNDPITLSMLRQIGVEGIVTALHNVPNGEVWTYEDICALRDTIEANGLRWSVVESLPVSESIKYGGADCEELIGRYKQSLENLGRAGIHTVCYNFMPVLDWARTTLEHPLPNGTSCLYFNLAEFAYFDIYIIGRARAEEDYSPETLQRVAALSKTMTAEGRQRLVENIIVKTQGFVNGNISENDSQPVKKFRQLLALYDGITAEDLRRNLQHFLEAIMPVCREWDINMCIHPDDPPMPILGLPRIVTNASDIERLLLSPNDPHNGLTFCAGSLSAGGHNVVVAMARRFASRTHFVHLRSCDVLPGGDFVEASHLAGRANLTELCRIFQRCKPSLPMRVDHAPLMLGDESRGYNAGYSFHGRMLALGQVSGMMAAVATERQALFDVRSQVVIITGGTGVLGREIARHLTAEGATVVILGRNEQAGQEIAQEIGCHFIKANVLDRSALEAARAEVMSLYGRIDALLNAAGGNMPGATIPPEGNFLGLNIDDFQKVLNLNLTGTVLPTQVFIEPMVQAGRGTIVNFSSMAAFRPMTRVAGYAAAKAAISNFTAFMATEVAKKFTPNIRVNAIAPGFFLTQQNLRLLTNEDGSLTERGTDVVRQTPFGRFGKPEELCSTIQYLISPASSFVTGTVAVVDGGFNAYAM